MGDVVVHKASNNLAEEDVEGKTVIDLIATGRVESKPLKSSAKLSKLFDSFNFDEETVQLVVHNRQSRDEQMIAVFHELELVLRNDYKTDPDTRALVSEYQHALSDQKPIIARRLENRLEYLDYSVKTHTKKVLEVNDRGLLIDGPVSNVAGQRKVLFAYAWYENRWCIAKIGKPSSMKAEWEKYISATKLYRSRSLVDILACKTHEEKKALLIMPYEGFALKGLVLSHSSGLAARPSIVFDVVLCVLAALSALAYHGMSHNDIKPSNIVGACNVPHLFVLIDLGSLTAWHVDEVPGTTDGYGDGVTPNTPSYDAACLHDVIAELVAGKLRRRVRQEEYRGEYEDEYKDLLRILEQPLFPRKLHVKHTAEASAPAVAQIFWELAERVKALATSANISTIDLDIVKPRLRNS
ncbi:hypothetical protein RI367_007999 [Sorochytrium milnesiophthora]